MEQYKTIHENKIMLNPANEVVIKKVKHTLEYRIKKVMNFYYDRGQNRESVNEVYRNLLKLKFKQNA